tara:strand:- start:7419 stop:11390 length:3972 start_codon:yes stop_codon:yes gene_type:complete
MITSSSDDSSSDDDKIIEPYKGDDLSSDSDSDSGSDSKIKLQHDGSNDIKPDDINESSDSSESDDLDESDLNKKHIEYIDKLKKNLYNDTVDKTYDKFVVPNLLKKEEIKYYLNNIEKINNKDVNNDKFDYILPHIDDTNFNLKLVKNKQFLDTKYKTYDHRNINTIADKLCNSDFELAPHQIFVKNFLSVNSPYNNLLLYHGLGTGKTCSAITIAEETRQYLKYMNKIKRIIIVASPNVQENFKLQLFDERKLKFENGKYNLNNCVGNSILDEININTENLSRETIIKNIKNMISAYYIFLGYIEFANYIIKTSNIDNYLKSNKSLSDKDKQSLIKKKIKRVFDNRLIIIDEIHNIRMIDNNSSNKLVGRELLKLVTYSDNIKLLLLSATPMYNDFREIIYLINIMNINDKRHTVDYKDIFDISGNFLKNDKDEEIGKELFIRKITGYISFIRGDNPITFPYRIYPEYFSDNSSMKNDYPKYQFNKQKTVSAIKYLDLYYNKISEYQHFVYDKLILNIENKLNKDSGVNKFLNVESLGYIDLQKPLEALNICYPNIDKNSDLDNTFNYKLLIGKSGLNNVMVHEESSNPPSKYNYDFKKNVKENIFDYNNIGKYSSKIKNILDSILNSSGPIIVYSQFIDGGLVPVALALESLGFRRYNATNNLMKNPGEELDIYSYKKKSEAMKLNNKHKAAKYIMITGDELISPKKNIPNDINVCTNIDNVNGENIKIILLSLAGSEGLDFKFIRQIHILEPWYNLNRIEQIIGRGVRTCSHKDLELKKRNTMIYLHSTLLNNDIESIDNLIYKKCEKKSIAIGKITRVLKETSVDCLLNSKQQEYNEIALNTNLDLILSNNNKISYKLGDKINTPICDFMNNCYYTCNPNFDGTNNIDNVDENLMNYSSNNLILNYDKIKTILYNMFREKYYYYINDVKKQFNFFNISNINIENAIQNICKNESIIFKDKYNNPGHIIKFNDLLIFQPSNLDDKNEPLFSRMNNNIVAPDHIEFKPKNEFYENKVHLEKKPNKKSQKKTGNKSHSDSASDSDSNSDSDSKSSTDSDSDSDSASASASDLNIVKKYIKDLSNKYTNILNKDNDSIDEEYKNIKNVYFYLSQYTSNDLLDTVILHLLLENEYYNNYFYLLKYLFDNTELTEFEDKIKKYFSKKMYNFNDKQFFVIPDKNKIIVYLFNNYNFNLAEHEDIKEFNIYIEDLKKSYEFNQIIGFMDNYNNEYIFKTINILNTRSSGGRCNVITKTLVASQISEIIKDEKYFNEINNSLDKFHRDSLCIIQEIILRIFQLSEKDNKIWFMSFENSVIFNLKKYKL